jgi:hypothetical protein
MRTIEQWAARWSIPVEALQDLKQQLGALDYKPTASGDLSETDVQNTERLRASRAGGRLWRNNVGVLVNDTGRPVRYGLCNESSEINKRLKSSDLIGIKPVLITPAHVGQRIGQFVARETKRQGWKYSGTEREAAQLAYLELVFSLGGDAQFVAE